MRMIVGALPDAAGGNGLSADSLRPETDSKLENVGRTHELSRGLSRCRRRGIGHKENTEQLNSKSPLNAGKNHIGDGRIAKSPRYGKSVGFTLNHRQCTLTGIRDCFRNSSGTVPGPDEGLPGLKSSRQSKSPF
jgi:hypothetical protein